jgi:adenosylcobinamide-GDP ribazoletransferase
MAVGTWTSVRTAPPQHVDVQVAGAAIALGPLLGFGLGFIAAAIASVPYFVSSLGSIAVVIAAILAVAALAWLTRALHLDGLADTADGLGSGRTGTAALDVMRKSDIGPFGVITLVFILLLQIWSIADLSASLRGLALVVAAVVIGRLAAMWLCVRGNQAATGQGLGALVVGSVPGGRAVLVSGACVVATGALVAFIGWGDDNPGWLRATLALIAAFIVAGVAVWALRQRVMKRIGGLSGDVLGAAVEIATTCALVVSALVVSQG